jgi:hypothetical protein
MSNKLKIRCTICGEVKDEDGFHNKANSKLGRDRRCKPCKAEIRHEYHLSSEYNLTVEEYDNMLNEQGGTCANESCNYGLDDDHKLYVDHCHATGTVRGLLCHWCNSAEGYLKSSPEVAQGLLNYMKKHNNERS